jgi:broad specificity phosphatase PhoE
MILHIHAVRYGQTYFNRYNKLQGWSNPPLTEQGLREADEVGKLLEDIDFQGVYSPDTERAQVTAQHIVRMNKASDGVHPKTVMNFREQSYVTLKGRIWRAGSVRGNTISTNVPRMVL